MKISMIITVSEMLAATIALTGCGPGAVSYKNDVQPILAKNCLECHMPGNPGTEASGLDMSSYESLMKGTKFGPVVKPGDPFTSALNMLVEGRAHPSLRMPHGRPKLPDKDIQLLKTWVAQGAKNN
jgi:hypothetical protein